MTVTFRKFVLKFVLLGWMSSVFAATEMLDQVVAIVDDDIIMASELRERLNTVRNTLEARGVELPAEDVLVRETLDRLILESIQFQKGRRAGVRITDAQLDGAMQRIAAQNGMTPAEFSQRLQAEGESYAAMREQVRREMVLQRVQGGNVNQRVQLSPQEIDNFLATEEGRILTQEEYRFVHALLPLSPDASNAEVKKAEAYVNDLAQRIQGGESFDQVISAANEYTFTGGDLGWRKREDLPSTFSGVAESMKRQQTSDPIRSASGFHIIYLADKRGGEQLINQTSVRHILVKPSEIRDDDQSRQLVEDIRQRVIAGEQFADLAREYSEDIGSAQEGGELGWTSPGQMVPEFEQAMAATPIGELSEPVRSQFGWHVLEVLDRREQDVSEQMARNKAREFIYQRKYQEELDAWLRKIRDEAFVDIK